MQTAMAVQMPTPVELSQKPDRHESLNTHTEPLACGASQVPVVIPLGMLHHESSLHVIVQDWPRVGNGAQSPRSRSHVKYGEQSVLATHNVPGSPSATHVPALHVAPISAHAMSGHGSPSSGSTLHVLGVPTQPRP